MIPKVPGESRWSRRPTVGLSQPPVFGGKNLHGTPPPAVEDQLPGPPSSHGTYSSWPRFWELVDLSEGLHCLAIEAFAGNGVANRVDSCILSVASYPPKPISAKL